MHRAQEAGLIEFSFHNPRDMATDKHRSVDDRPYGGGPGMVLLAEPLAAVLRSLGFSSRGQTQPGRLLLLAPKGRPFSQTMAGDLASALTAPVFCERIGTQEREEERQVCSEDFRTRRSLTLICGRYEGVDARIEDIFPVEAVSVGDFVLNGGEAAALCVIEAVTRLIPGYMGHEESGDEESFSTSVLEYPHYTRPEVFEGLTVPKVLLSGDHGAVAKWRRQAALAQTLETRPELLHEAKLQPQDTAFLQNLLHTLGGRNFFLGLVHFPVLDKLRNSVAVSLTNLDIHDIARSSCTYGLAGFHIITPMRDQQELAVKLVSHWTAGPGKASNQDRSKALSLIRVVDSIEASIQAIAEHTGRKPLVAATSAKPPEAKIIRMGFKALVEHGRSHPILLLFGTGHGLAPSVLERCDAVLPPVRLYGGYNHLSVRAAAAIILDRIFGDWM